MSLSGREVSNWLLNVAWSGTPMGPRPIKALVLGVEMGLEKQA